MSCKLKSIQSPNSIFSWCCYDFAISAYFSIVTTFIFATYFTQHVASNKIIGTHQWGNALALSGIIIAITSPLIGAIADRGGHGKRWLFFLTYLGILTTSLFWFIYPAVHYVIYALILLVISNVSFELAFVFYNSALPKLAPAGYLGRISGWAWGAGYLGGLFCLSLSLLIFFSHPTIWLDQATLAQVRINGPLVALWVLIFSLPLFLFIPDIIKKNVNLKQSIIEGLKQCKQSLYQLRQQKNIFLFLLAHMIYSDGLNTLFAFGGIYAAGTFHMDMHEVLEFGIAMNITAGIGAVLFAWFDDWFGSKKTILISIGALIFIGIVILVIYSKLLFWLIAPLIGLFIGPNQAASRSLMARIAIPEQVNETFGLYSLSGKATAFLGPWLLGETTLFFGSQRAGMATIFFFFLCGGILLLGVKENQK
jgi:UMF1 family MFS transporter